VTVQVDRSVGVGQLSASSLAVLRDGMLNVYHENLKSIFIFYVPVSGRDISLMLRQQLLRLFTWTDVALLWLNLINWSKGRESL
jgi:hypothetical protein